MAVVKDDDPGARPSVADDEPSADEQGDEPVGAPDAATADGTPSAGDGGEGPALDLTPRTGPGSEGGATRAATGGRRGWVWVGVLVVLVGGIGFVISRAITDATQYYLTADEAVARKPELLGRSFRLEGTVKAGSPRETDAGVTFTIASKGTEVTVNHVGDPPQLFQDCIPVVVEGRWADAGADGAFASTAIIVAHDETYEEQNSERIQQARAEGAESAECAKQAAVANR